ncbi:NucA/NucB deoxyribonuclease domain-containing protein [Streptomyces sp. bgisy082]|uniref:NucA/NucB deoxyribonuclease domain-containing protein n=1 Tax=Streptomyces sp. bgisy082 TaxID=3413776 RepID=UPI003D746CE4
MLYGRGGDLNRPAWSIKGNVCKPIRPTNSTGLDCDEHPFGATWEGPAAGTNFSVKYLDLSQNRSAGAILGNWYTKDRIPTRTSSS